jgi:hypothetical protein
MLFFIYYANQVLYYCNLQRHLVPWCEGDSVCIMCVSLANVSMNCWCLLEPSSALKMIVWGNLVWGNANFEKCFVALHMISVCYLIRLKRIYNFWCSMLVFTPFALCFIALRGVFMRFPELTYWQDATVPVPCFLLFFVFQKWYTGNILGIGWNKSQKSYFSWEHPDIRREEGEGPEATFT